MTDAPEPRSSSSNNVREQKGLLRFDIIDEEGWEWIVLRLSNDAPSSIHKRRTLEQLDLSNEAKFKVNDRRYRFSWTNDGMRDTDDKKVKFTTDSDDVVVSDIDLII